jgi:hypothetical protein
MAPFQLVLEAFLPGPQKLGTGGTLILVWNRYRGPWPPATLILVWNRYRGPWPPAFVGNRHWDRGHPPKDAVLTHRRGFLCLTKPSTLIEGHPFILGWSDLGTRLNTPAFLWAYGPPAIIVNEAFP